jgi:hypothetical protein
MVFLFFVEVFRGQLIGCNEIFCFTRYVPRHFWKMSTSTAHHYAVIRTIMVRGVPIKNIWYVANYALGAGVILTWAGEPGIILGYMNFARRMDIAQEAT